MIKITTNNENRQKTIADIKKNRRKHLSFIHYVMDKSNTVDRFTSENN